MAERQQLAEYIFTVPGFLSPAECRALIEFTEAIGYGEAPINTPGGAPIVVKSIRNNDRVIVDDHQRAQELWQRAQAFCPPYYKGYAALGLNERFRFYRYDRGHVFRWHKDGAFRRENGETSRLTFMVYLNDDFEGGETLFEKLTVAPRCGMALVFAHGYLHEGGEVLSGRKYVLRSDVMYSAELADDD